MLWLDAEDASHRARRDDEIAMFASLVPGVLGWTRVERALWA